MKTKKATIHGILVIFIVFLSISPLTVSQVFAEGTGEVAGFVKVEGSGTPVIGANVQFEGGGITLNTITDSSGHYIISNAPAGSATITASKFGVSVSPVDVIVITNASVQAPDIVFPGGPGAPVAKINVPVPSSSCCGISVGFDGKYIYYSNYLDHRLFAIEPDGSLFNTLQTGLDITAMAWDAGRQRMWAYNADDGFVYLVNLTDGSSTKKFQVVSFDGLAYDAGDDTLWSSPDASGPIYHYKSDGTLIKTLNISFPNSGLAVGGSVLYAGSNGQGNIYKINKLTGEILSTFATPGGRDEDLECDNISFAPRTVMWSKDAYNNTISAFEVESGTCIFGGAADDDKDGIPDDWETKGFDANGDGTPDIDLKALGADPNEKDIFVYVDWLYDDGIFGLGGHTHKPDVSGLNKVILAFGDQGISLHVIFGKGIKEDNTNKELGSFTKNGDQCDYGWGPFNEIRSSSFLANPAREPIFHYVLFGHDMGPDPCQKNGYHSGVSNSSSGSGSDFLVTLGHWTNSIGTPGEQAGTFMHELGHNLGLGHGGVGVMPDGSFKPIDTNYKPNHLSVMNYHFATSGLVKGNQCGIMDYLRFGPDVLPPLKEDGGLNEKTGFGAGTEVDGYGTSYWCSTDGHQVIVLNIRTTPIDWNCTDPEEEEGVTASINQDAALDTLTSDVEWTHLTYKGGAISLFGVPYIPPETTTFTPDNHELTVEEDQAILRIPSVSTTATFEDVPDTYWAWSFVERLFFAGITSGCALNPLKYCPDTTVTRSQMAVFLLRGIHSSSYSPPVVGDSTGFSDVPTDHWAAAWIKQLAAEAITAGCGNGNYCPETPVTRSQMAVFLLRSKYGSSYTPPVVGDNTGFSDVPTNHWAAAWIKQLAADGITGGCDIGVYCPESPVTRAQMAVFLVRTFNLP